VTAPSPLTSAEGTTGRDEWVLDPAKRHLNHGSYGAVPRRTLEHQAALKRELERNPLRWFDSLPERLAAERAALAPFLGSPAHELAVIPNASAGASTVLASTRFEPGDEILVTDHVYGAVLMAAERAARRDGGVVRAVGIPLAAGSEETLELITGAVGPRTRMLIVDHVSSATARAFPVEELVAALEGSGVTIVVDGAHTPGLLDSPARVAGRSDGVVWFGNLHKFASAPRAAAVLVARGETAARLYPPIDSWGATLDYPERFDQQGTNDVTGFLSASYGIAELERLFGWQRIRDYAADLAAYAASIIAPALEALQDVPARPHVGMAQPAQPLLRLPDGIVTDGASQRVLKNRLSAEADVEAGIMVWRGQGFLRISAHAYNVAADYEQFVERGIPVIASMARSGASHSPAR